MAKLNFLKDYNINDWTAPALPEEIPHGDMPGDKVEIDENHVAKAGKIFPELLKMLKDMALEGRDRAVITVCGGSGVGKSEIASLLSFYFNELGIGSYTMSGDNYPRRIPMYNDAERLRIFRESGIEKMIEDGVYTEERFELLHQYQLDGDDANKEHVAENPWFKSYLEGGIAGLKGYLGTMHESGFEKVEAILDKFKAGENHIWLKRMGRTDTELWYSDVDFSDTGILIIEWTHGNSDNYKGVDIPVLLNSTPQETLAHRRVRNRDGKTDSPFTMRVLEVEQGMLHAQAKKAKIIVSKAGELLTYEQYLDIMKDQEI